jgi:hypothetical protein
MRPLCLQCRKKPIRSGSRFCTNRCASDWLYVVHSTTDAKDIALAAGTKARVEELANDGSEWCSSCRAWVFPDESRHLAHPFDSPSLPMINVAEY